MRLPILAIGLVAAMVALAVWMALPPGSDVLGPPSVETPGPSSPEEVEPDLTDLREESSASVEEAIHADPAATSMLLASLRGQVLVDDELPREQILLRLFDAGERRDAASSGRTPQDPRTAQTDSRGRFAFDDLPVDFAGRLLAPRGYELEDRSGGLTVSPSSEELVVRLHKLRRIVGRVVRPGARSHAPEALLRYRIRDETSMGSGWGARTRADARGRFAIPVGQDVGWVVITALDSAGEWAAEIEVGPDLLSQSAAGDLDLGDIVLSSRTLSVLVVDPQGHPVPRAEVARVFEAPWSGTEPVTTDAQGYARVPIPSDSSQQISARAEGFWPTIVKLDPPVPRPVTVTLRRANKLVVTVMDRNGDRPAGVHLSVHRDGEGSVFATLEQDTDTWLPDGSSRHWRRDCSPDEGSRTSGSGGLGGVRVELCASARLELHALWPEVPLTIELSDAGRSALLRRVLRPLGVSETREVRLVVPGSLRRLTGTVTDRRGIPIPGATIGFASTPGGGMEVADQEGRFAFDSVSGTVSLRIWKEGYVAGHYADVIPPIDGSPLHFELEEGLTTHLSILDELGRSVSGASLSADVSASWNQVKVEEISPGSYRISDLPPWQVPVHASIAGRRYTIDHDAGSGDAAMVVPPHSPLTIEWEPPARQGGPAIYVVLLQPLEAGSSLMIPIFGGIPEGLIQLPNIPIGEYRLIIADGSGSEYWIHPETIEVDPLEGTRVRFAP